MIYKVKNIFFNLIPQIHHTKTDSLITTTNIAYTLKWPLVIQKSNKITLKQDIKRGFQYWKPRLNTTDIFDKRLYFSI